MVGRDVRDHMVPCVHGKLGEVVQLPGLAGLYTDTRIGVRRAVMGLVAGIPASPAGRLAPLVPRSGALVLVFLPTFVPALDFK